MHRKEKLYVFVCKIDYTLALLQSVFFSHHTFGIYVQLYTVYIAHRWSLMVITVIESHCCYITAMNVLQAPKIHTLWVHCANFSVLKYFNLSKCVLTHLNLGHFSQSVSLCLSLG